MLGKFIHPHLVFMTMGLFLVSTSCTGQQQASDDSILENEPAQTADPTAESAASGRDSAQAGGSSTAVPSVKAPSVDPPTINVPEITPPGIDVPEIDVPTVDVPEIDLPEVTVPEVIVRQNDDLTIYTLPADILFDFDQSNIRPDAEMALQQISASIAERFPNVPLQVRGHTDAKGGEDYNLALSQRRSASVKQWLITNASISPNRISTQGYGESQPVAPNTRADGTDNPSGRQLNRRVEIVALTP